MIPQTLGLIRAMFDQAELPKALGSIGPVMGLAGISGPLLGGLLTHADLFGSSWRAVFAVNLPSAWQYYSPRLCSEKTARPRAQSRTSQGALSSWSRPP